MTGPVLQVEGLTKTFGGLTAVDKVNFSLPGGGLHAIIGPNGAGKTTFFNLISGFLGATSGSVIFNGENIIGRKPHEINRLGIARTLLHDPEVLILDEPANGLDPNARIELRQILLRLAQMGKTLIVTSHILPELSRICDTVAIITKGKLRAFGTLEEVVHQVRQKRMIEIELVDPNKMDRAVAVLEQNLESGAQIKPSKKEGEVRLETDANDQQLASLLAALVHDGLAIAQFHEVPLDLEDAFMTVTERDRQSEADTTESQVA